MAYSKGAGHPTEDWLSHLFLIIHYFLQTNPFFLSKLFPMLILHLKTKTLGEKYEED